MKSFKSIFVMLAGGFLLASCSQEAAVKDAKFTGAAGEVKIITLDPGHFHAALVQKSAYDQVSTQVHVYAPEGAELQSHMALINGFNSRSDSPTSWEQNVYAGDDFLEKMIQEKKGNVMVTAGNNRKKTDYIKRTLEAGINVLADKPMVINTQNFETLKECFKIAEENDVLLYDIMTERYEITTMLQGYLSQQNSIYGEQLVGSAEDPAIVKESVHHFYKLVDGRPLIRPAWFFDVEQEGDGIVDVTTHLVDLVQYEAFPGVTLDYTKDYEMIDANRWTTTMTKGEFCQATALEDYPEYLDKYVTDDNLSVYCNGDIIYKLKGIVAKVSVIWNYTFPEGGGDTHYSIMKGSKSNLVIKQGEEQGYRPELYVEVNEGLDMQAYEKEMEQVKVKLAEVYPGVTLEKQSDLTWYVSIPDSYRVGHEAHFGEVTKRYLGYLIDGKLPEWEVPNMISKYYVTTKALEIAKAK